MDSYWTAWMQYEVPKYVKTIVSSLTETQKRLALDVLSGRNVSEDVRQEIMEKVEVVMLWVEEKIEITFHLILMYIASEIINTYPLVWDSTWWCNDSSWWFIEWEFQVVDNI